VRCPIDGETLVISERQGVEIDYCPTCRGVWLDRGELDKLIDREATRYESEPPRVQPSVGYRRDDDDDDRHRGHGQQHKRKKKGFLSEIFEMD
jgi:Zn-finger nucleic acid-binding protein